MKLIKTIFALALAAFTISCSNLTEDFSSTPAKNAAKDGMAYIRVSIENQDKSSFRTLLPQIETTNLVLKGGRNGSEQTELAKADSIAELEEKEIEIQTGEWNFTLTAMVSGVAFTSGPVTATIESGSTNPLSFTLEPADTTVTTGTLDFSLTFTGTEDIDYQIELYVKGATNQHMTLPETYKSGDTIKWTMDYTPGTYKIQLEFYAKNTDSNGSRSECLNLYRNIFRIQKNLTTKATITDFNLNQVYSITYDGYEAEVNDDVPVADTFDGIMTLSFSRKSSAFTLPVLKNQTIDGSGTTVDNMEFSGWYKDEALTDGPVTEITPSFSLKNLTLYAKWLAASSGNLYTPIDYNFTFVLKDQYGLNASQISPGEDAVFTLTPTVTRNGTELPITITESGKTLVENNEVIWTASLLNDGKLVTDSINITPNYSTGKISLTVPAQTYQDKYVLKLTANYQKLSYDASYLIECKPSTRALPLTLEAATSSATVTFVNKASGSVSFKVDGGNEQTILSGQTREITLASAGAKVEFFGDNASYGETFSSNCSKISCDKDCYVYGNIMSLVYSDGYENADTLTGNYTFANLFYNNTKLKNKADSVLLLPATTLANHCYEAMFSGCTGLTSAPALPAEKLAKSCYQSMFSGCESLTSVPALPADQLTESCYSSMFYGCKGLTSAPALPATTLAESCYKQMFGSCTGLTSAPALPATTLAKSCYQSMFSGCKGLTEVQSLPATTLAVECYVGMFRGCTSLTTAPALPVMTLAESCYAAMFRECTSLTTAPALPATTLAEGCYSSMFYGCTSLETSPVLPATTLAKSCYSNMFHSCTRLNKVTCLAQTSAQVNVHNTGFPAFPLPVHLQRQQT